MKNRKIKRGQSLKIFNKFLFCLIIIVSVYYVIGINDLSIKGFVLRDFKQRLSQLADESNELEYRIASLQSFNQLNQKIDKLNLVAVGEIEYLEGAPAIVAKK